MNDATKTERLDPIERARRNPKSRALALRAYLWDFYGLDANKRAPEDRALLKEEFKLALRNPLGVIGLQSGDRETLRQTTGRASLKTVIQHICYECVGGSADPGPKQRVSRCTARDCPLHPVRGWKDLRGRYRVADRRGESISKYSHSTSQPDIQVDQPTAVEADGQLAQIASKGRCAVGAT